MFRLLPVLRQTHINKVINMPIREFSKSWGQRLKHADRLIHRRREIFEKYISQVKHLMKRQFFTPLHETQLNSFLKVKLLNSEMLTPRTSASLVKVNSTYMNHKARPRQTCCTGQSCPQSQVKYKLAERLTRLEYSNVLRLPVTHT